MYARALEQPHISLYTLTVAPYSLISYIIISYLSHLSCILMTVTNKKCIFNQVEHMIQQYLFLWHGPNYKFWNTICVKYGMFCPGIFLKVYYQILTTCKTYETKNPQ